MRIVDLTRPVVDHFRWPVERTLLKDHAKGDLFQITRLGLGTHAFTHVDAPRHYFPEGATTSDVPLEATVGPAAVIDLFDVRPNEAVDARRLASRAAHLRAGDVALLATAWDRRHPIEDDRFWREAPFLTRDAAEWLLARGIKALAVDFPQDFVIRDLLDGIVRPIEEHVTHDVLLRRGVILIEYLANTQALERERVFLCCLPLKIPDCDGAPARVVAFLEGPLR
ncbi:MAG: cyclase family protein [Geminicoccaceae bacterium]|nr:cyclase family protein [Geminicoccaceae bacterium]MCX7631072.1 cyclase family protein [Geminicoccaceae bacterium]